MDQFFESIKKYLPQYLSVESTKELLKELEAFHSVGTTVVIYNMPPLEDDTIYQGDGMMLLPHFNEKTNSMQQIPSIVISNTCDIDPHNSRKISKNVCYAPLMKLNSFYEAIKVKFGKAFADSQLFEIKNQKITNILYLPQGAKLEEEYIAFLDKISNTNNKNINRENLNKDRLFTFSNFGFYLFLLKLSINFTRIQEKVDRTFA